MVAIIALLTALLYPTLQSVIARADSAGCLSNLRQIGIAINSYTADNNGMLPGPLSTQQRPRVTQNQLSRKAWYDGQLAAFLAPYVDTEPFWKRGEKSVFACPAWAGEVKGDNSAGYLLNQAVWVNGVYQSPGQASSLPWGYSIGANPRPPGRMVILPSVTLKKGDETLPTSATWMLKDADAGQGGISFDAMLPGAPVHGNYRNALFYDFHVGQIDLADRPL